MLADSNHPDGTAVYAELGGEDSVLRAPEVNHDTVGVIQTEGIDTVEVDRYIGKRSMQGSQPRTAIGMVDENHYVFVVVDGRSTGYSRGMTLIELAQLFQDLGCTVAYNFDGGGSATMYFNGELVNNPLGEGDERGTSDIVYIAG